MGSVGLMVEDEFQTSTGGIDKNDKLSRKLLDDSGGGVDYSIVPRKQRSAIKKRARESITPPFPIVSEQNHDSNEAAQHKSHAKKSKRNKKKGRLTKDEKEVAQTLHALAEMFSDATKTNKSGTNHESSKTKSSTTANGDAVNATLIEESKKISTRASDEVATHSQKLVDSTSKSYKFPSLRDAVKTDLAFGKQSDTPGVQVDIRQKMPFLDINRSNEQAAAPIQDATHFAQSEKRSYKPRVKRSFGSYQSPKLLPPRDPNSKTQVTQGLPAWLENAVSNTKLQVNKNTMGTDKHTEVGIGSKAHWKRNSSHVHICRLINVLQVSGENERLQEKHSQLSTFEGARCVPIKMINEQGNGCVSSSGMRNSGSEKSTAEIQNALLLHQRLIQDQQMPFKASSVSSPSTKQGTDFSPLGTIDGHMKGREGINGFGNNSEAWRKLQASYLQSQNKFVMPFSLPRNGYSSHSLGQSSPTASQQVQVPSFITNPLDRRVMEPLGQLFWPQQRHFNLQTQYNHGGVAAPVLADWKHGGRDSALQQNYSQSLLPHVQSAMYQQRFSQPQQQFMAVNSSLSLSEVTRLNNSLELQKRWFFTSTNL